jgi:hypothetical protein
MVTRTRLNATFIRTLPVLYNSRLPSILCLNATETIPENFHSKNKVHPSILILRIIRSDVDVACNVDTSDVRLVSRKVVLSKTRQIRVCCNRRLKMQHEITIARSENEGRPTDIMGAKCEGLFDVKESSAGRKHSASKRYVLWG